MDTMLTTIMIVAFALPCLLLYFAPSIVAHDRHHPLFGPVLVINLLLGWTLIGWAVALAMAVSPVHAPGSHTHEVSPHGH